MVEEEYVKSRPPEKVSLVEVAAEGKGYAKVVKPLSLLNQERAIDEDAMVLSLPVEPTYANP